MAADVDVRMNRSGEAQLRRLIDARIGSAVRELRDVCRASVGTPYPPASEPFTPPHRRSGGLQRAIFAERIRQMDWALGVRRVEPHDGRPGSDRSYLGLWLELGTGLGREPFPVGAQSILPRGNREDSAATGHGGSSMAPRPFLVPVLVEQGPGILRRHLGGLGG